MRIRWGRVGSALIGIAAMAAVAPFAGLGVTAPATHDVARRTPGARPCATADALQLAATRHAGHPDADPDSDVDARAAAEVLAAAACTDLAEVPWERQLDVFHAAKHAVAWIEAHETGGVARDDLLSVFELASDQARVGSLVNAGVWFAIGAQAADAIDRNLHATGYDRVAADDRDLAEVQRRLVGLAQARVDWAEVDAREERVTWELVGRTLLASPTPGNLVSSVRALGAARTGDHAIHADIARAETEVRARAAVLAAVVEMARSPKDAGCALPDAVYDAVAGPDAGFALTLFPTRCAVVGHAGDDVWLGTVR